jgi:hypothetical protein
VQHAVDAEAHDAQLAPRLDVDVAGALLEGVLPQPVDDVTMCWSLASRFWPVLPSSTSCSKFARDARALTRRLRSARP